MPTPTRDGRTPETYPPYQSATVPPVDPAHIRTFPPDAAVGVAIPVDIWAHCPIDIISFANANWRADKPVATDGRPSFVTGTLELLDSDTARLVIDLRYFPSPVEVVIYRKTTADVPPCL
jgi:hypothetical protein